ncbi:MAG: hypothetical protein IPK28_08525 [Devosia sp.]|nr:hypothetical protein [Devosia sp.]
MPPQQAYDLLDLGDYLGDFGAHCFLKSVAAHVVDYAVPINPFFPDPKARARQRAW